MLADCCTFLNLKPRLSQMMEQRDSVGNMLLRERWGGLLENDFHRVEGPVGGVEAGVLSSSAAPT